MVPVKSFFSKRKLIKALPNEPVPPVNKIVESRIFNLPDIIYDFTLLPVDSIMAVYGGKKILANC